MASSRGDRSWSPQRPLQQARGSGCRCGIQRPLGISQLRNNLCIALSAESATFTLSAIYSSQMRCRHLNVVHLLPRRILDQARCTSSRSGLFSFLHVFWIFAGLWARIRSRRIMSARLSSACSTETVSSCAGAGTPAQWRPRSIREASRNAASGRCRSPYPDRHDR